MARRKTRPIRPRETNALRRAIERRTTIYHWGQRRIVTPRLVSHVFGDGQLLIGLAPMMYRPNRFVVRIDSAWHLSNWAQGPRLVDRLDNIYDAIEDEYPEWPWAKSYGLRWTDDEMDDRSSRTNFGDGCTWWEMDFPRVSP